MSDKPQSALDLLPTAKDLLKRGMWPQAEVLYRHIIQKDPSQAEAYNDLGIARACQNDLAEAESLARQAVERNEESPIFRVNLAKHLFGQDRMDDAEAEVYAALALDWRHHAAIEALDLMQKHRKQAIADLAAREAEPIPEPTPVVHPEPEVLTGPKPELVVLSDVKPKAVRNFAKKTKLKAVPKPRPKGASDRKKMIAAYSGTLGKPVDADAVEETPDQQLAAAYKLFSARDYDAVILKLRRLEADHPGHPLSALWTALCHFRLDDLKRARRWADRAAEIAPNDHAPQMARGLVLQAELAFEEAEEAFHAGIELAPKNADFHSALAFQKLLAGDWPEGWRLFDKVNQALTKVRLETVDPWKGERLDEEKLHLWALEGVGDFLMMARLLPEIENRAGNLTIECDERLIPLLKRSVKSANLIGLRTPKEGEKLPVLGDVQSTDRGVIRHLSPDLHPTELETGSLQVDQARADALRKSYQERFPGQLLVGVSWYTTSAAQGRARSILPTALEPMFAQSHCQFIDLQYRDPAYAMDAYELPEGKVYRDDTVDSRDDFDGLAAQLAALDLVITVDNSTAQLAGALGVPGWVLLHQLPDWRWGLRGDSSNWYPSLRLFRQSGQGDWASVLEHVCEALENMQNSDAIKRSA